MILSVLKRKPNDGGRGIFQDRLLLPTLKPARFPEDHVGHTVRHNLKVVSRLTRSIIYHTDDAQLGKYTIVGTDPADGLLY